MESVNQATEKKGAGLMQKGRMGVTEYVDSGEQGMKWTVYKCVCAAAVRVCECVWREDDGRK